MPKNHKKLSKYSQLLKKFGDVSTFRKDCQGTQKYLMIIVYSHSMFLCLFGLRGIILEILC